MPYFRCRLATEEGAVLHQSLLASTREECRRLFEAEGFYVLSVSKDWGKIRIRALPFGRKVKDKDFIMFNQELVALIKSGYPILKSIETLSGRAKNIHFKEILMKVENDIRQGKSLSEAFMPFEKLFSRVYIASLMAGERSGNLSGTLTRFINYAKVISQTKSRIRSALIYPSLLLGFSLTLMSLLITFILPKFSEFYANFEAELPWITRWIMSFALAARRNFPYFLGLLIVGGVVFFQMRKKSQTQVWIDRAKLKIPYGRTIWRESGISLFARTLGLLLEAGISLLHAIGIASHAVPNKFLIQKMGHLPERIKNGESLSESLAGTGVFSPLVLDMIRIGESSANLEGMLAEAADFFDERTRGRIDTFVSLIEPVVIIFMGLIVAGMLLSVYLPIFNIIRVAR